MLGTRQCCAAVRSARGSSHWFVYSKRPFSGPKAVLAYLSRYTHRVAISTRRLIAADACGVTFTFKDYRIEGPGRCTRMTLQTSEFIRRFLIHVLPKGFHRIRHYGLFASTRRAANIARLRELLGAMPPAQPQDEPAETVLPPCPCCGGRMKVIEFFERGSLPRYRPFSAAVTWFDTS
jgi:Putative transposase